MTIPTIEPVDKLEEDDFDDSDVEVLLEEVVPELSPVCVDGDTPLSPPDVVVAALVCGVWILNPFTCTPHITEGVDKDVLVVV